MTKLFMRAKEGCSNTFDQFCIFFNSIWKMKSFLFLLTLTQIKKQIYGQFGVKFLLFMYAQLYLTTMTALLEILKI